MKRWWMVPVLMLLAGCAGRGAYPDMIPTRTLESLLVVSKAEDRARGHKEFDLVAECVKASRESNRAVTLPAGRYQVKAKWRDDFITGDGGQYVDAEVRLGTSLQVVKPVDFFDANGTFIDVAPGNSGKDGTPINIVLKWRFVGRDEEGGFLYDDDGAPQLMEGDNAIQCILVGQPIEAVLDVDFMPAGGAENLRGIPEGDHGLGFTGAEECPDPAWTDRPRAQLMQWRKYLWDAIPLPTVQVKRPRLELAFRCDPALPVLTFRYEAFKVTCNRDGRCGPGETRANCPEDCPKQIVQPLVKKEPERTTVGPVGGIIPPPSCNQNGICDPNETSACADCKTELKEVRMCSGTGPLPRQLSSYSVQNASPTLVCAQDDFSCMVSENGRLFEVKPRATYRAKAYTKYRLEKCK